MGTQRKTLKDIESRARILARVTGIPYSEKHGEPGLQIDGAYGGHKLVYHDGHGNWNVLDTGYVSTGALYDAIGYAIDGATMADEIRQHNARLGI